MLCRHFNSRNLKYIPKSLTYTLKIVNNYLYHIHLFSERLAYVCFLIHNTTFLVDCMCFIYSVTVGDASYHTKCALHLAICVSHFSKLTYKMLIRPWPCDRVCSVCQTYCDGVSSPESIICAWKPVLHFVNTQFLTKGDRCWLSPHFSKPGEARLRKGGDNQHLIYNIKCDSYFA